MDLARNQLQRINHFKISSVLVQLRIQSNSLQLSEVLVFQQLLGIFSRMLWKLSRKVYLIVALKCTKESKLVSVLHMPHVQTLLVFGNSLSKLDSMVQMTITTLTFPSLHLLSITNKKVPHVSIVKYTLSILTQLNPNQAILSQELCSSNLS